MKKAVPSLLLITCSFPVFSQKESKIAMDNTGTLTSGFTSIYLTEKILAPGMYILTVTNQDLPLSKKFICQY